MAARPAVDAARMALVGVSLGAFLSLALGTEAELPIQAIVDISGGLIAPWDARATAAFPPTLILHGTDDPVVPATNAHALDALLTQLGVAHELHLFPHEGHWFSTAAQLRLLGFIASFLGENLRQKVGASGLRESTV